MEERVEPTERIADEVPDLRVTLAKLSELVTVLRRLRERAQRDTKAPAPEAA